MQLKDGPSRVSDIWPAVLEARAFEVLPWNIVEWMAWAFEPLSDSWNGGKSGV